MHPPLTRGAPETPVNNSQRIAPHRMYMSPQRKLGGVTWREIEVRARF